VTRRFLGGKVESTQDFYLNSNVEQTDLSAVLGSQQKTVVAKGERLLWRYNSKCKCVSGASLKTVVVQLRFMANELEAALAEGKVKGCVTYELEIQEQKNVK
jgi:hypothetical protein